ncbi:alpha/beta-hydrolase [Schizopora paradoxa]|uniref:Alpha/beta-hydrolase n=1 Tax=Schizopora paradoxa TaxID=27342 RepID=A0A0H2SS54_9AGAM|nr:alpha/beta-hydrolase [Schizopora paradoxa]
MDFVDPSSFHHRTELLATGKRYHFVDELPKNYDPDITKTIICIHGFPDLWYGWRHQIPHWRDAGYRVVAPDMLGYGGTDKPGDIPDYGLKSLSSDIAALLDFLQVKKAIVVGHDWGAATVWRFALYFPERVLALAIMSVPFYPPAANYASLEDITKVIVNYGYQLYFADPASTKEIEDNLENFLAMIFVRPYGMEAFTRVGQLRDLLLHHQDRIKKSEIVQTPKEFAFYLEQFTTNGMGGPLSYYKTTDQRFKEEKESNLQPNVSSSFPVLFMWGSKDASCPKQAVDSIHKYIPRLTKIKLEGKGHWVLVEAQDAVTSNILDFIEKELKGNQSKL